VKNEKELCCEYIGDCEADVKGLVDPKIEFLSLSTHPHVVPNPQDLRSSLEHKLRYTILPKVLGRLPLQAHEL